MKSLRPISLNHYLFSFALLVTIFLLPLVLFRVFPPGVKETPNAPQAARDTLSEMGPLSRDEWITAVVFIFMITAWIFAGALKVNLAAVAIAGLGTLLGVFLNVGIKAGVPVHLMGFALLFASSYFSTLTPQGGSQNVIFVASDYLTQGELYRLGLITTSFCTIVFLVIGTPWILWVGN